MNFKAILLSIMIFFDLSLHVFELLGKESLHPLYPIFPLLGFISYDIFWTIFWAIGFILAFFLIFSGISVKTINKIIMPENRELENKIQDLTEKINIIYKKVIKED